MQFLISKIGCQNQSNFRSDARNKVATRASHSRPTQFLSVFSQSGASGAINAAQQLMMAMARVFAGLAFGLSAWWRALLQVDGRIASEGSDPSEAILVQGRGRGGVGRAASGFSQGVCGEAKRGGVLQAPRSA